MVVGGNEAVSNFDVEMIDISDKNRTCAKPFDYPGAAFATVGGFVGGKVLFCGGDGSVTACFQYNQNDLTWTQASDRPNLSSAEPSRTFYSFSTESENIVILRNCCLKRFCDVLPSKFRQIN